MVLRYSQNCAMITMINFRTFSTSLKETPHTLAGIPNSHSLPLTQMQAATNSNPLCLYLTILDISHVKLNLVRPFVTVFFCVAYFQSSSVACSRTSYFYGHIIFHCGNTLFTGTISKTQRVPFYF